MYYDLLSKVKNAEAAKKDNFTAPFSKFDFAVARILVQTGYLKDAQKKVVGRKQLIEMKLAKDGPKITGLKIVSKPSRRIYADYRNLRLIKHGFGIGVLSTSKGLLTTKEARKQKVGGEYLFELW